MLAPRHPSPPPALPVDEADGPVALLRFVVRAVARNWRTLLGAVLAGAAIAFLYAQNLTPKYSAMATIILEPQRPILSSGREAVTPAPLDLLRTESELQVLRSERLLTRVFDVLEEVQDGDAIGRWLGAAAKPGPERPEIGTEPAPGRIMSAAERARRTAFENFKQRLTARRVGHSYVIEISYTSSLPYIAARGAQAAAAAYLLQSIEAKYAAASLSAELVQGRIDSLAEQVRRAEAAVRSGSLPDGPMPDADARIIGAAQQPLTPVSPRKNLILSFGAIIGLLSALMWVTMRETFDNRIRGTDRPSTLAGLPVLAVVPEVRRGIRRATPGGLVTGLYAEMQPAAPFSRAVVALRASVEAAARSRGSGSGLAVALLPLEAGAGCSVIAANLAQCMGRPWRSAVLVDADIYARPAGPRLTGDTEGGTSVLGTLTGDVCADAMTLDRRGALWIWPAINAADDTTARVDLSHPKFPLLIDQARTLGTVVIDMPPLEGHPEVCVAAGQADAIVLVARGGVSTTSDLQRAVADLSRGGASILGVIITRT